MGRGVKGLGRLADLRVLLNLIISHALNIIIVTDSIRQKISVVAVVAFVATTGTILVMLAIMFSDVAEGLAIALLTALVMVGAALIYYKVSGKPLPILDQILR